MIKIIELKVYRKKYYIYAFISALAVAFCYILVSSGVYVRWDPADSILIKNIFLYGTIGIAFGWTFYLRKEKEKMLQYEDFDAKKSFHEKLYTKRIMWYLFSCSITAVLYVIAAHTFFLYFALIDLVIMLLQFPNKTVFSREFNDDDIVFM